MAGRVVTHRVTPRAQHAPHFIVPPFTVGGRIRLVLAAGVDGKEGDDLGVSASTKTSTTIPLKSALSLAVSRLLAEMNAKIASTPTTTYSGVKTCLDIDPKTVVKWLVV